MSTGECSSGGELWGNFFSEYREGTNLNWVEINGVQEKGGRMRLKDKVAIITGAGAGIGKASAELFAKEGAKIVVADIDPDTGKEVTEEVKSAGGEATFIKVDTSSAADAKRMIQTAIRGVELSDEKLAMDVIHEVGPGGAYISHEHSLLSMRSQSQSKLFDRRSRSDWMEMTQGKSIVDKAYETAIDILQTHQPHPLPNGAPKEMRKIVKEFEKEVREEIKRIRELRSDRDKSKWQKSLDELHKAAEGEENLMPYIIAAVKEYASIGEIMNVLKQVFGTYVEDSIF